MKILKFGGSSLATGECIARVAAIVGTASAEGPVAVVVSALGGVTNDLGEAAAAAARGKGEVERILAPLAQRHFEAARAVASAGELAGLETRLRSMLAELAITRGLLEGMASG